jgi:NAD(P)-dependent dehydrogenase (short-subunit alcohol dehydrogenase family)
MTVYYCCKYALPYMQAQGKGSIINTASFVTVMGACGRDGRGHVPDLVERLQGRRAVDEP